MKLASALALCTSLLAQDPPVPPGGFPIVEILDQPLTYADGYRTRYDLRLPDPAQVPPPVSGWPFLLLVHGFAGGRGEFALTGEGASWAGRGYITVAYDVRGQGQAGPLNPGRGSTMSGGPEKADMADLFQQLEARLGAQMDSGRLCVAGVSQGGEHSWAAAAWSEQLLPQARGSITHFPKIAAVCPRAGTPDIVALWNPDAAAFSGNFTRVWFRTPAVLDPTFQAQMQQIFLNQDFNGLTTTLRGDPWRQEPTLLTTSKVPVLQQISWDDFAFGENRTVDAVNALPSSTERFVYLTTGLHQSPKNQLELAYADALVERWLGQIVKGFPDEVTLQPDFLLATIPADPTVAQSPTSVWQLRQCTAYPASGATAPWTLYLRQGGALAAQPPAGVEPADRVTHAVPAAFTPLAWVQTGNVAAQVFAAVPLSSVVYRGPALPADTELLGRAQARIHVSSTAPDLQVGVALLDEDASGQQRYVAGGHACVRGRAPGVTTHDVTLRGSAYTFEAGHRIVLAVENHVWHRPLGISELRTAPYFSSYTFDCLHDTSAASWIQLPVTPPLLGTRANALTVSRGSGGSVPLIVAGAAKRGGSTYAVLASLSGTVPGFPFLGVPVPINFDGLAQLGLTLPTVAPFQGFVGLLDASGAANAGFAPAAGLLPSSLVGTRLSFAGVTLEPGGAFSASAPSQVLIVP